MKKITRVVVLHGYGVTPRSMWFPWLHALVEARGVAVFVPALPDPLRPDIKKWYRAIAPFARTWGEETAIVAHSAGGVLALRLIEKEVRGKIGPVFLAGSPYAATLSVRQYLSFFAKPIDWAKIRAKAASFTVLHAKDDPLVPYDHAMRYAESLGGDLVLMQKGGHLIGRTMPRLGRMVEKMLGV